MNLEGKAMLCSIFILFTLFSQVVPYQGTDNKQILERLAKVESDQEEVRKLRSEIDGIKKIFTDVNIDQLNDELVHNSRAKRSVQAIGYIRTALVKILGKLKTMESKINQGYGIRPYVRGPPGPRGVKGEKGDSAGSTTFIRWGKTACPNTKGTVKVYAGRIGGQHYTHTGGTSSQLCLSMKPTFASRDYGNTGQYIYGTEYEVSGGSPFTKGKSIHDHEAPCVLCRVASRSTKITVNGRNVCPAGWTLEYHGYLMSEGYGHKGRTQAICVDVGADTAPGTHQNLNGNLLYTLQASCGSLPCHPYIANREITCAVCTK